MCCVRVSFPVNSCVSWKWIYKNIIKHCMFNYLHLYVCNNTRNLSLQTILYIVKMKLKKKLCLFFMNHWKCTGTCFIQKIYTPSSSLLQSKHLPFSPSPLRLNIFRLCVILSLTQLYRYTPEIFLFSTATFKYTYRANRNYSAILATLQITSYVHSRNSS